jgi:carbamate kinase
MMDSKFAVLAIGGNSLIKNKNHIALSWQYEAVKETGKYIADLIAEGHFRPGSMKPKIESSIQFLEGGGERAIITSPENLLKSVRGESGTTIVH